MHATIADIRRGDIFTAVGKDTAIATDDAEPWGHNVRYWAISLDQAGLRPDGVYELGCTGADSPWGAPDTPILIHQRNVAFHHHIHDAHLIPGVGDPDHHRVNAQCRTRDEMRRVVAIRAQRGDETAELDAFYRKVVREAYEARVGVEEIQDITGLSRARVYQIKDGKR